MAVVCSVTIKVHTATSTAEYIILNNLNLCSQNTVAHICLKINSYSKTGYFTLEQSLESATKSAVLMPLSTTFSHALYLNRMCLCI